MTKIKFTVSRHITDKFKSHPNGENLKESEIKFLHFIPNILFKIYKDACKSNFEEYFSLNQNLVLQLHTFTWEILQQPKKSNGEHGECYTVTRLISRVFRFLLTLKENLLQMCRQQRLQSRNNLEESENNFKHRLTQLTQMCGILEHQNYFVQAL